MTKNGNSAEKLAEAEVQPAAPAEATPAATSSTGHYLVVQGRMLRVVNAWQETSEGGRTRWRIVTEDEPATSSTEACLKCGTPYDPDDKRWDGRGKELHMPFCRHCAAGCADTEIADHWCAIDQWRVDQRQE